jgi:hypothetical protein
MKRVIALTAAMLVIVCLTSCSGTNSDQEASQNSVADNVQQVETKDAEKEDSRPDTSVQTLKLDEVNTVENYLDFSLVKVETTKVIKNPVGSWTSYECAYGNTYVDVVLDVTNTSASAIRSDMILAATASNDSGSLYTCDLYAQEFTDGSLSEYESINPLANARLHCGISVPEGEDDLTIKLDVNGQLYQYKYTLGEASVTETPLKKGQTIEEEDFASVKFVDTEYTSDLLPSNTSGSYRHYECENKDSVYLAVKFDITNLQSSQKDVDSFVGVKVVYDNKYNYSGFCVVEDSDGKGFSSYEDLAPMSKRTVYCLIEVPKAVKDKTGDLIVTFAGTEYTYSFNSK